MPDGTVLYYDPSDYVARQLYRGGYEPAERWACRKLIRPSGVVLDVGANVGVYSQLGARLTGPQGRVVAFEPGPALPRLRLAVARLDNVEVVPAAAGAESGTAVMRVPAHQSGLASLRANADELDGRTVAVVRLDECDVIPAGEIDLIKIDVEGYEDEVLRGAEGLYEKDLVRATLVEVSFSFGSIAFVRAACERFGLRALTLSYRAGLRYVPIVTEYTDRDVEALGQANVLLLRSDVDWSCP